MSPREIALLRKRLGLSQAQFARQLQVARETIVNWEAGKKLPLPANRIALRKLTRGKGVSEMPVQRMTAQQVKRLRESLCLTQSQFADMLHVDRLTVLRWEAGTQSPHPAFVAAMNGLKRRRKKP